MNCTEAELSPDGIDAVVFFLVPSQSVRSQDKRPCSDPLMFNHGAARNREYESQELTEAVLNSFNVIAMLKLLSLLFQAEELKLLEGDDMAGTQAGPGAGLSVEAVAAHTQGAGTHTTPYTYTGCRYSHTQGQVLSLTHTHIHTHSHSPGENTHTPRVQVLTHTHTDIHTQGAGTHTHTHTTHTQGAGTHTHTHECS